jgi:alkaline phosphatase D
VAERAPAAARRAAVTAGDRTRGAAHADTGFKSEPIENMVAVGAVSQHAARIWIRVARPDRLIVHYDEERGGRLASFEADARGREQADNTLVVTLPHGGDGPLEAGCGYRFSVCHADDGSSVGEGRFETAPASAAAAPDRFAVAIMSCNQPFDAHGRPARAGAEMLEAAAQCLETHATKLVLTIGDQMYVDYPPKLSLFEPSYFRRVAPPGRESVLDCTADEVRALLQQRHRYFWNMNGWRRLHARYACYPMLDDHELVDNWGSDPAHGSPAWRAYARGARAAFFDYQGSRVTQNDVVADDFDFELVWGPLAIYALDVRSNRRVGDDDAAIYSRAQHERLLDFLERHRDRDVVCLVLPVPAVHLPRLAAKIGRVLTPGNEDFSDRWSTAGHVDDRDRLLRALHRHQRENPEQRLALLSGDIHLACAHAIKWSDGTRPLLQFVSSGITNKVGPATRVAAKLSILANQKVVLGGSDLEATVRLLQGAPKTRANPFTDLNLGLLELERNGSGRYGLRLLIYGHRAGEPVCVYRSPLL